jgi:hypothetical protein
MKKIFILLLFILIEFSVYSQCKCNTDCMSHRIDSLCKAKNVSYCEIFYNSNDGSSIKSSKGIFKFDGCFLIVNERYFNLSKMISFSFNVDSVKPSNNRLYIVFQGQ